MDGALNDPNIFFRGETFDGLVDKIKKKFDTYSELRNLAEEIIAERQAKSEYEGLDRFKKDARDFGHAIQSARIDIRRFKQGGDISREDLRKIFQDLEWWEDKIRAHVGLPRTTSGVVLDLNKISKRKRA